MDKTGSQERILFSSGKQRQPISHDGVQINKYVALSQKKIMNAANASNIHDVHEDSNQAKQRSSMQFQTLSNLTATHNKIMTPTDTGTLQGNINFFSHGQIYMPMQKQQTRPVGKSIKNMRTINMNSDFTYLEIQNHDQKPGHTRSKSNLDRKVLASEDKKIKHHFAVFDNFAYQNLNTPSKFKQNKLPQHKSVQNNSNKKYLNFLQEKDHKFRSNERSPDHEYKNIAIDRMGIDFDQLPKIDFEALKDSTGKYLTEQKPSRMKSQLSGFKNKPQALVIKEAQTESSTKAT